MATVIERNGRFLARVRLQGFTPVTKTFHRKTDAVAWGRRVEADMQAGRWQEDEEKVPTLSETIDLYKADIKHRLKGATAYSYWLDEFSGRDFAKKAINKVTSADLAVWRPRRIECVGRRPAILGRSSGMPAP